MVSCSCDDYWIFFTVQWLLIQVWRLPLTQIHLLRNWYLQVHQVSYNRWVCFSTSHDIVMTIHSRSNSNCRSIPCKSWPSDVDNVWVHLLCHSQLWCYGLATINYCYTGLSIVCSLLLCIAVATIISITLFVVLRRRQDLKKIGIMNKGSSQAVMDKMFLCNYPIITIWIAGKQAVQSNIYWREDEKEHNNDEQCKKDLAIKESQ